ncbi:MAG: TetR/AcrR family transcriptional regulator [Actinomycetota bacterium]
MSHSPTDWPVPPEVTEPQPSHERRSWGKVSHSDRFRRQRRDLLRAAARLAAREGYEGTRVADIVAEAGLSKSTFYEHFGSKEECFVELNGRTSAQMLKGAVDTAEATIDQGPFGCLGAVIRSIVGYADRNPRLAEVLRAAADVSQTAVRDQREQNMRRVIHFFVSLGHRLGSPLETGELDLSATIVVRGVTDILGDLRREEPESFDRRLDQITRLGCRAFGLPES